MPIEMTLHALLDWASYNFDAVMLVHHEMQSKGQEVSLALATIEWARRNGKEIELKLVVRKEIPYESMLEHK